MGIVSRFKDIMNANVNAVLSKAEGANADKLLEKYIRDAKESLGQIKAETAAVIAEEMALARKLSENDDLRKKYEGYAVSAVKSGNDDDAKKFLNYNMELQAKRTELAAQYEAARENSEKMRQMTAKLLQDIAAASAKLDELKQKLSVAKQQEKLNALNEKITQTPLGNFDNLFDAVQKRVDAADAAATLNMELSQKTGDIEDLAKKYEADPQRNPNGDVEDQLARLKADLGVNEE